MLNGRGEENSARFISLLEVKRGSRTEAKRWGVSEAWTRYFTVWLLTNQLVVLSFF